MRFRILALQVALAVSCGCIPARDNPLDPAIAPRARLALIDMGPGLDCPPQDVRPTDEYDALVAINRGRCLALDARESSDPQGKNDIQSFRFTLPPAPFANPPILEETTVTETGPLAILATSGLLVLRDSYRQGLPLGALLNFEVTVYDRGGHRKTRKSSLTLLDEAPRAGIARGFSVPSDGLPWASGIDVPLRFDGGTSDDPENDRLSYCWTYADVVDDCSPDTQYKDISIPAIVGRTVVELSVIDSPTGTDENSLRSRPTFASAWAEGQPLWELSNGTTLERIDTSRFTGPYISSATLHRSASTLGVDLVVSTSAQDLLTFLYPGLEDGPSATSANYLGAPISDPIRNRIWAVGSPDSANGTLQVWDVSLSSLTALPSAGPFPVDESRQEIVVIDSGGHPWIIASQRLYSIAGPGAAAVEEDTLGGTPLRLEARPRSSEVWVLTASGDSQFLVYSGPGTEPAVVPLGALGAFGFTWTADGTELWVSTVPKGLVRLDAEFLLAVAPAITGAITADMPEFLPTNQMVVDPITGELWTSTGRIGPDLSFHVAKQAPRFIGSDGWVWSDAGGLRRGRSAGGDRTLESILLGEGIQQPSIDLAHGSVWGLAGPPRVLQEVTAEGIRGRRIGTLAGGATVPDYPLFSMRRDGLGAWVGRYAPSGTQLEYLDFTANPPAASGGALLDGAPYFLSLYSGFSASAASEPPFVWTVVGTAAGDYFPARILLDGTVDLSTGVSISTAGANETLTVVTSAKDGAACISRTRDVFNGTNYTFTLNLYRAAPGGTAVLLGTTTHVHDIAPGGSFDYPAFVAASRGPGGGEMCWAGLKAVGYGIPDDPAALLVVIGADSTGIIRSFTRTGFEAWSVVPVSADEVWIVDSSSDRVRMTDPDVGGVFTATTTFPDPLYDPVNKSGRRLIGAEAQSNN